ncbi:MAG TPA: hypothetical protein PKC30_09440 [Saprospiraceae bacterium]|nr:hypothetical protein [Saprospiraceae bacterium]
MKKSLYFLFLGFLMPIILISQARPRNPIMVINCETDVAALFQYCEDDEDCGEGYFCFYGYCYPECPEGELPPGTVCYEFGEGLEVLIPDCSVNSEFCYDCDGQDRVWNPVTLTCVCESQLGDFIESIVAGPCVCPDEIFLVSCEGYFDCPDGFYCYLGKCYPGWEGDCNSPPPGTLCMDIEAYILIPDCEGVQCGDCSSLFQYFIFPCDDEIFENGCPEGFAPVDDGEVCNCYPECPEEDALPEGFICQMFHSFQDWVFVVVPDCTASDSECEGRFCYWNTLFLECDCYNLPCCPEGLLGDEGTPPVYEGGSCINRERIPCYDGEISIEERAPNCFIPPTGATTVIDSIIIRGGQPGQAVTLVDLQNCQIVGNDPFVLALAGIFGAETGWIFQDDGEGNGIIVIEFERDPTQETIILLAPGVMFDEEENEIPFERRIVIPACPIDQPIPAMGTWSFIILGMAFLIFGLLFYQRQNKYAVTLESDI